MAKKSLIQRSIKKYLLNQKYLKQRNIFTKMQKQCGNVFESFKIQILFQSLPQNSSQTRFKRFCWKTGRNRGFFKDFNLSRHIIREMSHTGLFPGIIKSSW